jgi:alkylation response protein AidB-like acyl-CoA dehydrogenase
MSSDPSAGIQLYAKAEGDSYILNGTKCFITNGGIADTYLLSPLIALDRNLNNHYNEYNRWG